jgi:hypothetical protein
MKKVGDDDRGKPGSVVTDRLGTSPRSVGDGFYAAVMAVKRTGRCAYCGETFTVERRSGPTPSYCSPAHRQRAYEARRRTVRTDEATDLAEQVRALRSRVTWLEHENHELRRERDETFAEMVRLREQLSPTPLVLQRLADPTTPSPEAPAEHPPTPKRRWNLSR